MKPNNIFLTISDEDGTREIVQILKEELAKKDTILDSQMIDLIQTTCNCVADWKNHQFIKYLKKKLSTINEHDNLTVPQRLDFIICIKEMIRDFSNNKQYILPNFQQE